MTFRCLSAGSLPYSSAMALRHYGVGPEVFFWEETRFLAKPTNIYIPHREKRAKKEPRGNSVARQKSRRVRPTPTPPQREA